MRFKEGMRRLGLVLGFLGAGLGFVVWNIRANDYSFSRHLYEEYNSLTLIPSVQSAVESAKKDVVQKPPFTVGFPEDVSAGIKVIELNDRYEIESFTKTDGTKVFRLEAPSRSAHFWSYTFPLFGFIIPWGTLRIVTWIVSGFLYKR